MTRGQRMRRIRARRQMRSGALFLLGCLVLFVIYGVLLEVQF